MPEKRSVDDDDDRHDVIVYIILYLQLYCSRYLNYPKRLVELIGDFQGIQTAAGFHQKFAFEFSAKS